MAAKKIRRGSWVKGKEVYESLISFLAFTKARELK